MKNIIFFDIETNGLKESSVLSLSALKVKYYNKIDKFIVIDIFDRYYYRIMGEAVNKKAIEINGLTDLKITQLRNKAEYPKYFKDDIDSFVFFCENSILFVAHNIDFDKSFLCLDFPYSFCTMKANYFIKKKWLTLAETVQYYHIQYEKEMLHQSIYDTYLCFEIFLNMYNNRNYDLIDCLKKVRILL